MKNASMYLTQSRNWKQPEAYIKQQRAREMNLAFAAMSQLEIHICQTDNQFECIHDERRLSAFSLHPI
jgi:hypothetical protein